VLTVKDLKSQIRVDILENIEMIRYLQGQGIEQAGEKLYSFIYTDPLEFERLSRVWSLSRFPHSQYPQIAYEKKDSRFVDKHIEKCIRDIRSVNRQLYKRYYDPMILWPCAGVDDLIDLTNTLNHVASWIEESGINKLHLNAQLVEIIKSDSAIDNTPPLYAGAQIIIPGRCIYGRNAWVMLPFVFIPMLVNTECEMFESLKQGRLYQQKNISGIGKVYSLDNLDHVTAYGSYNLVVKVDKRRQLVHWDFSFLSLSGN
jgi:hypothetical protein